VRTTRTGQMYETLLTAEDRRRLHFLIQNLARHIRLPPRGAWRRLSSEELWARIVSQVCVMGAAAGMEQLSKSEELVRFQDETSLSTWRGRRYAKNYMSAVLRKFSATRFANRAAQRLKLIATASDAVHEGKVVVYRHLDPSNDSDALREEILRRFSGHFGRKSASDFMVGTGLSRDVLAIDQRVVGFLNTYLSYPDKFNRVQGSRGWYLSIEAALRDVCEEARISVAHLDQILFKFSGLSSIAFFLNYEYRRSTRL
jgi:thermostable 8-oxoguanine DNA glycosylase